MHSYDHARREVLKLLGASALAAAWPAHAQQKDALRFGIQTSVWGAVGLVAEAEKLFDKVGAMVTILKLDSGRSVRDAMIAGRIDIGSLGAAPFVVGAAKGDMAAIGTVAYAGGTLAVVASTKSAVKSVAELKGRKIASQIGSETDHVFQTKIAPAYGLKKGDFQVVNVKFQDHVSAMAGGSVDAFAGVEPYPSVAEVEGLGAVVVDYSKFDIVPVILAINRSVLESRQEAVTAFMRGWLQAVRMFREQAPRTVAIVHDYYKSRGYSMSEEVFRRALARMDVNPTYRPELKGYLTDMANQLIKRGQVASMPDWDRALDQSIAKRAATA